MRPLRPQTTGRPRYPHFNEPRRYARWFAPLALSAGIAIAAPAIADPLPPDGPIAGGLVAPMFDVRVPMTGDLGVHLSDGSYARVVVTYSSWDDLEAITVSADLFAAILGQHLSRLDCHTIATEEARAAAIAALHAYAPDGAPVVEHVSVTVLECGAGMAHPGMPVEIDLAPSSPEPPTPEAIEAPNPRTEDIDCRYPRPTSP